MLSCIATISVNGPLRAKLRAIADAGFEHVEIFESDLLASPEPVHVIGAMMRDLGLTCVAFQPFRDFEGMPANLRHRVFDRAERKFDVLQALGTDLMLVSSNVSPDALADRGRIVDDFRELGERASARGLRVGFEALAWARHVRDHRDAWEIVRQVDHPAVGLVLDAFSSLAPGIPIDSINSIRHEKLFHVQIADAPKLAMDPLSWSRHFRCMPGQGDLPLVEYVGALRRIGYDGVLSLEIFNDRFRAGSTADVALDGMRSLDYLLEQVERASGARVLPDPRTACQGIEFIEFCASEEEAKQLGQMLHTLGFAPTHRHVRKAVTRWRQGDINLVVNCEPDGFAHSYDTVHGASVCAIGLRVADPDAALRRAGRLRVESFSQPVGPGEYEIPALRGVGGSLLYFMKESEAPSIWRTEFEALPGSASRGAGLERIDHFSQSMQYEEMLSWLLYYVTLFQVEKSAAIEIADPVGLVQSQAIQSGDRNFRVLLNSSAAGQTLVDRFLHAYGGAGVQQVSFATRDIFATAARLRELGMDSLPIPENYYYDLGARFGLQDAVLSRMAELNILYDEDERGSYHHLYTRAFAKRFFFEVVHRHDYDGYGARDTAIRLAAQSRFRNLKPGTDLPPLHPSA
ncbi:MAG TPA: TIM barrel protein [Steroidobacteraceae bacterium]|nr:TIM barrel protein [Steroidobacteraceae bacterium]